MLYSKNRPKIGIRYATSCSKIYAEEFRIMGTLRLFLAVVVMLGHYLVLNTQVASAAVCCFYVISGFYIQLLLSGDNINIWNFYINRALRIYPIYWFFLILNIIAQPMFAERFFGSILLLVIYWINSLTCFGHDVLTLLQYNSIGEFSVVFPFEVVREGFSSGFELTIVGVSWSIAIEIWFYIIAPFLLRLRTAWIACIMVVSMILNIVIFLIDTQHSFWIDAFFPSQVVFFLIGSMGHRYYRNFTISFSVALNVSVPLFMLFGYFLTVQNPPWWLMYYGSTLLVSIMAPFLFALSARSKFDRFIGNLSYPIYLSHLIVFLIMMSLSLNKILFVIYAVFLVSVCAYFVIEYPITKFRHKHFSLAAG